MNNKIKIKKIYIVFLLVALFLCSNVSVLASEIEDVDYPNIYKDVALNFFEKQYLCLDIKYNELEVEKEVDLENNKKQVVAKTIIVKRDDKYDYLTMNLTTSKIDEFVLDSKDCLERFSGQVYYSGLLEYYYDNSYDNNYERLTSNKKNDRFNSINKKYELHIKNKSRKYHADSNPIPVIDKNGFNGFYDFSEIEFLNEKNEYFFNQSNYLSGITESEETGLLFWSQDFFNLKFDINNSCGPTAMTNILLWYDNSKNLENKNGVVNLFKNDNVYDAFDRLRELVEHDSENGTKRSKYNSAFKTYAQEQGYDCTIKTGINEYEEFKECIDSDIPVLTSLSLSLDGDDFGHAVVTIGYRDYYQDREETTGILWWKKTVTKRHYTRYYRVVDGWNTSNNVRYIDAQSYWDDIEGRGVVLS